MSKNPNQEKGILVTVSKRSSVNISIPCKRLNRRLYEFLLKADVRHTEYHFIVEGTGRFPAGVRPAIGVTAQPGSTIHFEISINLPDGEFFKCSLVAPVKCGEDNLIKVFADTATNICNHGWFTSKSVEPTVQKQSLPVVLSANEQLARKIETWFKAVDVEQAGLKRSVNRLNEMIYELEAKREKLLQYLGHLRS